MDNSELLRRDLLDRLAENVRVLEPDARQQHDLRAQHVRRVVPPAETRLDDRDVDLAAANAVSAAAVIVSNWVAATSSAAGRTRASASSRSAERPPIRMRSSHERTCGDTVDPTERPSPSSNCSIVTVAVDFPFVPTTWMAGTRAEGCRAGRATPSSGRARSRPRARGSARRAMRHAGSAPRRSHPCATGHAPHRGRPRPSHEAPPSAREHGDSACAITSAGVGGWRRISIISLASGSPLAW